MLKDPGNKNSSNRFHLKAASGSGCQALGRRPDFVRVPSVSSWTFCVENHVHCPVSKLALLGAQSRSEETQLEVPTWRVMQCSKDTIRLLVACGCSRIDAPPWYWIHATSWNHRWVSLASPVDAHQPPNGCAFFSIPLQFQIRSVWYYAFGIICPTPDPKH